MERSYRWWRFSCGADSHAGEFPFAWVKLGPLSFFTYTWFDNRRRYSWSFLGGREHIAVGGSLT